MSEFQEWCEELLPVVRAAAKGERIEVFARGYWREEIIKEFRRESKYRIRPSFHEVNGFSVPRPVSSLADRVVAYFTPEPSNICFYDELTISGLDGVSGMLLARGALFETKEAAIANAKAMLGINPNE